MTASAQTSENREGKKESYFIVEKQRKIFFELVQLAGPVLEKMGFNSPHSL